MATQSRVLVRDLLCARVMCRRAACSASVAARHTASLHASHSAPLSASSRPCSSRAGVEDAVLVTRSGPVTTVTLNLPAKRNAVDLATARQLTAALQEFQEDSQAHVAVITGAGGNFCAGLDLKAVALGPDYIETCAPQDGLAAPMGPSRLQLSKPLVAAVAGYAVAGGLELALLADLRVAEESATFGVFCRRFGVPLIDGGTVRLPQLIGLSRALDLILTGRPVSGPEALAMGLANRLVPHGQALRAAQELAAEIASYPQACMLADRRSALHAAFNAASFAEALQFEYCNGVKVIREESVPGAQRFKDGEGRHGVFPGGPPKRK